MPPVPTDTKKKLRKLGKALRGRVSRVRIRLSIIWAALKNRANRRTFANVFMLCFIIFTSIGAGLIFLPAGWVVAGVCCGIFGFLLGLE